MVAQQETHSNQKAVIVQPSRDAFFHNYGRGIVLLCDECDDELLHTDKDAFSTTLLMLLNNPVSLILAHASLWKRAMSLPDFNADELGYWDIYCHESVMLFVPKNWKSQPGTINDNLGIDLTSFKLVQNPLNAPHLELPFYHYAVLFKEYQFQFGPHTLNDAFKLLMLPKDKDTKNSDNPWVLYVGGHGGGCPFYFACCGMSAYHFKDLILHINDHVNTKLLIYTSCYAGCKKMLHDFYRLNDQPLFLEFPTICLGFGDSYTICLTLKQEEQKNVWRWKSNWHEALDLLKNIEITRNNKTQVGNALRSLWSNSITAIPRIRWAHENSFELLPHIKPEMLFCARDTIMGCQL